MSPERTPDADIMLDVSELSGDLYSVSLAELIRVNEAHPFPSEEIERMRSLAVGESCFLSIGGGAFPVQRLA
jgi:hypothetical protein